MDLGERCSPRSSLEGTADDDSGPSLKAAGSGSCSPGDKKDLVLTYVSAQSTETGSISSPGAPAQPFSSLKWSDTYLGTHAGQTAKPEGAHATKKWQVKQAAKMGTKEWDLNTGAAGIKEQGTFELYHEPR